VLLALICIGGSDKTPSGARIVANSTIVGSNATNPAQFREDFFKFVPPVAYNIIVQQGDYSVEYDCGTQLGVTNVRGPHGSSPPHCGEAGPVRTMTPHRPHPPLLPSCTPQYCIHILSRTPTMDPQVEQQLLAYAARLGLNDQQIAYKSTLQDGCSYTH
jgi:hypothetical protein